MLMLQLFPSFIFCFHLGNVSVASLCYIIKYMGHQTYMLGIKYGCSLLLVFFRAAFWITFFLLKQASLACDVHVPQVLQTENGQIIVHVTCSMCPVPHTFLFRVSWPKVDRKSDITATTASQQTRFHCRNSTSRNKPNIPKFSQICK